MTKKNLALLFFIFLLAFPVKADNENWIFNPNSLPYMGKIFATVCSGGCDYVTDGTDDNVQIQTAIDTVSSNGGGRVFIKKGIYKISSTIVPKSNVFIEGEERSSTILQTQAGVSYTIRNTDIYHNFSLQNLTIDNNGIGTIFDAGNTVSWLWITDCDLLNAKGFNISITLTVNANHIFIKNNYETKSVINDGWDFNSISRYFVTIENNTLYNPSATAAAFITSGGMDDFIIRGNYATGTDANFIALENWVASDYSYHRGIVEGNIASGSKPIGIGNSGLSGSLGAIDIVVQGNNIPNESIGVNNHSSNITVQNNIAKIIYMVDPGNYISFLNNTYSTGNLGYINLVAHNNVSHVVIKNNIFHGSDTVQNDKYAWYIWTDHTIDDLEIVDNTFINSSNYVDGKNPPLQIGAEGASYVNTSIYGNYGLDLISNPLFASNLLSPGKIYVGNLFGIAEATTSPWSFSNNDIYNGNIGKIGIGTSTPKEGLHIYNGSANNSNILLEGNGNPWEQIIYKIRTWKNYPNANVFVGFGASNENDGNQRAGIFVANSNYPNGTGSFEALSIKGSTGNVGIGTTSPISKLDVYGNIRALGGSANHAVCWKSDGKTLGYCSSVVESDGSCACN